MLKIEKTMRKQDELRNNIIVSGIPLKEKDEDELKSVFVKIGRKMKVNLDVDAMVFSKIGKEQNQLKIVFENYSVKEDIMKAKKDVILKTKDFGFEQNNTIYINHDLTAENQQLLRKTREVKQQLNFKYAWYSQGKIFLRETGDSKIIHVPSENFLEDLKQKN